MTTRTTVRKAFICLSLLVLLLFPLSSLAQSPGPADDPPNLEFKGIVKTMPTSEWIGDWTIGDRAFQTDATTLFERGTPFVGACVKVDYVVVNTKNLAHSIKLDDDCAGGIEDQEAHGAIDAFPPNLVGVWTIGGQAYTATEMTSFQQADGPFAVGACVEVRYVAQGDTRTALSIKTDDSDMCKPGTPLQETKGLISALPTDGLIGA